MDPRTERTRQAVRHATLEVLGQRGYAAFTVEAVAQAARVAKSTIYRHWPTKLGLIADALETLNQQPRPDLDLALGTARDKVERLLEHLTAAFAESLLSGCIPALIEAAEHHREVADFLHGYSARRRQTLVDVLRAGIDSGELPAHLDAELAALALSGPVVYCRTMTPTPLRPEDAHRLATQVLGPRSLAPASGRGDGGRRRRSPRG
jgi:TetR/AcrR family transcriptional regulator of autoinduction and epiphytic fitness